MYQATVNWKAGGKLVLSSKPTGQMSLDDAHAQLTGYFAKFGYDFTLTVEKV